MAAIIELQGFNYTHALLLLAGLFALIPVVRLVRLYLKTRVPEYMLFGAVFMVSTLFTVTSVLAELTDELIFWIISYSLRNFTYFLFFIHTIRMTWAKPSSLIAYIGVILFAIVQMLIFLWTPQEGMGGAGFVTNQNNVIYSTEKRLLGNIFQLYVALLFFYGYMTVKIPKPTPRLKTSYRIMIGMSFLLMLSRIVRIIQNFGFPKNDIIETFGEVLLLLAFASVASLFYYYPGAIMLSRVQVSGLIVISEIGTPLASFKFESIDQGSELSGSSTLLAGIINALQSVMGELDKKTTLKEIDAGDRSILVHRERDLYFMIVTNTIPTSLLRSSMRYFAKLFFEKKSKEIENYNKSGLVIKEMDELIFQAFPYTTGLIIQSWE